MSDTSTLQETVQTPVIAPDDFQAYKASRIPAKQEMVEQPKADEPIKESTAEAEGDKPEADAKTSEPDNSDKKKGGWQRKIERLEREKQELAEKLAQRAETQKQEPTKPAATPDGKPAAPKIGEFDSYDKYQEAHDEYLEKLQDWKLDQREQQRQQRENQEKAQREQQATLNTWNERLTAAKSRIADFDEVIANATADHDISISDAMRQAIMTSEHGPELVYHLAKNLSEAERIAKLDPFSAAREMGKLEAKVATGAEPAAGKSAVKVSTAPPPVKPVGGSASTARTLDDAGDDYQKYKAERLKGRK